jgi:hypothetical protein
MNSVIIHSHDGAPGRLRPHARPPNSRSGRTALLYRDTPSQGHNHLVSTGEQQRGKADSDRSRVFVLITS